MLKRPLYILFVILLCCIGISAVLLTLFAARVLPASLPVLIAVIGMLLGTLSLNIFFKRHFDAARQSLHMERQIFQDGPVIVCKWVAGKDGPVSYMSANIDSFGYSADDFTRGKIFFPDLIHPEDRSRILNKVGRLRTNPAENYFEDDFRLAKSDGTYIWVLTSIMLVKDGEGNPLFFDSFIIDINERKELEETVRGHNEELERINAELSRVAEENQHRDWLKTGLSELAVRSQGHDHIETLAEDLVSFLVNYTGASVGLLYLSDGKQDLKPVGVYGVSSEAKTKSVFTVGEGIVGLTAKERKAKAVSELSDHNLTFRFGLGEVVPDVVYCLPLIFEDEFIGVLEIGSLKEISDLHRRFLEQACASMATTIHFAQIRKQQRELLLETQRQARRLQNQQTELKKSNDALKQSQTELEEQKEELKQLNEELQSQQEELRVANEELEEKARMLTEQRDSIQRQKDALERTRGELEQTSKYKSDFLANMSHELRTPLNSMLILSQVLGANEEGTLTSKQVKAAETIQKAGNELLTLINDVLDIAKVEAGKMDINLARTDIEVLFGRMEDKFEPQAAEKGLRLTVELSEELKKAVLISDEHRIEQIVNNLISNAIKFTGEGEIIVRGGISDGKNSKETRAVFSVTDTGPGIPKDQREIIFEAFHQVDRSTDRQYGGTGLGLSISRELAVRLGGELLLVESGPGGSRFELRLPLEPASEKGPSAHFTAVPETASEGIDIERAEKKLLIIEDDPIFAESLAEMAAENGFITLNASDARRGLELAAAEKPSAVILDIRLPDQDGFVVLETLKESPETRHIPVHVVSADDAVMEAMRMGAIGYLRKPVTLEGLRKAFGRIEKFISKSKRRLLVVEDDDTLRSGILELLDGKDVETEGASSGGETLEKLGTGRFDCMVLDIGLPDMDGFELLEEIRNNSKISQVPIIIYTGKDLSDEEESILQRYAESVIIKSAKSPERLLDETALFLHRIESNMPGEKQQMIRLVHDGDSFWKGKKILVADDDMRNIFALTIFLEEKGMETFEAKNGRECIEVLNDNKDIDLVLMDIMMPEMNGYEAIEEIRKRKEYKSLPIIAITAKAMKGDRQKCIDAGANDYLTKPIDGAKLLSMMRVWLHG